MFQATNVPLACCCVAPSLVSSVGAQETKKIMMKKLRKNTAHSSSVDTALPSVKRRATGTPGAFSSLE